MGLLKNQLPPGEPRMAMRKSSGNVPQPQFEENHTPSQHDRRERLLQPNPNRQRTVRFSTARTSFRRPLPPEKYGCPQASSFLGSCVSGKPCYWWFHGFHIIPGDFYAGKTSNNPCFRSLPSRLSAFLVAVLSGSHPQTRGVLGF